MLKRFLRSLRRGDSRKSAAADRAQEVVATCLALLSERGEVSGARLAGEAIEAYKSLDESGREAFFDLLVDAFSPDAAALRVAADAYQQDSSQANLLRLQCAVESPRQELFRRFNLGPGGTAALLALRSELLRTLRHNPERVGIDADLVHLFRSWFNRGFLILQRIDWRSSAYVLERLIRYEAVHAIQGWKDLRRRLEVDRRCYAYFHPVLPDEPIIFIEVALTRGMSGRVQPLLDADAPVIDPQHANCAMFYSITSCQEGLRGISFGNFLVKQVVEDLGRELPRVRTFATLSPIPGFRRWLESVDRTRMSTQLVGLLASTALDGSGPALRSPGAVKDELRRLCAQYLMTARSDGLPLDSVARFHLANGASLQRLNWMGDCSEAGIQRSFGLMVNYVYRLADVERNHEAYARDHKIVASREFGRAIRRSAE